MENECPLKLVYIDPLPKFSESVSGNMFWTMLMRCIGETLFACAGIYFNMCQVW